MEYIQTYIEYLTRTNFSENTCLASKTILHHFERFCREQGINNEKEVTEKIITLYINVVIQKVKHQTYANYLGRVKSYFAFLEQEGYIFLSPLREVELPFVDRPVTKILTEQEVTDIFNSVDTTRKMGIRLRAILELLYSSALRPCELVKLTKNDINFKNKTLFISKSKNLKDRVVPVGDTALFWIKRYINEVRTFFHPENTNQFLFLTNKKKARQLTRISLYHIICRTLAKRGITDFYPSMLRPSVATHMLARGMHIRHIQLMLGHSDIRTTQIYLRVPFLDLKKKIAPIHPADTRTRKPFFTGEKNNEL